MKKTIYLLLLSFITISLGAQSKITYKNFGEGWAIPINENLPIDVDENGVIDFYVNEYYNELGFTPIFVIGCFASPSLGAYTSFDARELSLFEEGDNIQIDQTNLYDYIDDDRGSGYSRSGGFAYNWEDKEDVYLGFALIQKPDDQSLFSNGWMKVSIDAEAEELIIKEWAFSEFEEGYDGSIIAGDKGEFTSVSKLTTIEDLIISPNPAKDRVLLSFDYSGTENLSVAIRNNVGQEIFITNTDLSTGSTKLEINTENWTNGMYFVQFETASAVLTNRLTIAK